MTTSAYAQIYSWRDAEGRLVLSDRRPAASVELKAHGAAKSYAVPRATTVRATRLAPSRPSDLYDDLIVEHAQRNRVRSDLVRAVVQVESAYNPAAVSSKGAMGLMQLMPATARQYGVANPFNPGENVRAGVAYLRELLDRYQGNEELALAAYNAGPTAVDRHGQNVPPYRETQNYLARISRISTTATMPAPRGPVIYKVTEISAGGRASVRYTDKRPSAGTWEIVGR